MSDSQPAPISEILEYRADQIIYCVEGELTKLYNAINTPHGTLRNAEITDSTGSIKITFVDLDLDLKRGQFIHIEATNSEKHGWVGCKLKEDRGYPLAVWVTSSAAIRFPGQTQSPSSRRPQSAPRDQSDGRSQQPPRNNGGGGRSNAPQTQSRPQQTGDEFTRLDQIIDCYAALRILVIEKYAHMSDAPSREAIVTQAVPTLFIEAAKMGIVSSWVVGAERAKVYPLPPKDPKQWRECVVPTGAYEGKTLADVSDADLLKFFDYYDDKKDNGPFAECVYTAAEDRGLLKQQAQEPVESAQDLAKKPDIPF